jgi:YVTN family beta-propeller protein
VISEDETRRPAGETEPAPRTGGGASVELRMGSEFAGHRIEAELGRGGMGVVYRARHTALDRERALKVVASDLASDPRFRARFARESRLAASIEHPNVIPVHHAGEESGRPYLSMRIVDGPDLGALVDDEGPLDPRRAAAIVKQVAGGLDAAHERGLVHRDVKPSNVLVEGVPHAERAYVTDFGISRLRAAQTSVTTTGEFLGTADYVAPEQIQGDPVDHRADVYSLGGLTHFLLTGEPPFPNRSEPAKLVAHTNAPRPVPSRLAPGLSRSVDAVVARAMAVDPESRYASASRFAEALDGALEPAPWRQVGASLSRIIRRPLAAIVLGIIVAAAIAVAFAGRGGDGGTGPDRKGAGTEDAGAAGQVLATISVGDAPSAVAAGEFKVWVTSRGGALSGISPASEAVDPPVSVGEGAEPVAVAIGFGSVWVVDRANDAVVRMDPGEGTPPERIQIGRSPSDVAAGERWLWVANSGDGTVSRIDPNTNVASLTVSVGGHPRSLAADGAGSLWVANAPNRFVSRIDASEGTVDGQPIAVGRHPSDVATGGNSVWVLDDRGGRLYRIDPEAGTATGRPIDVGSQPGGLAVSGGSAWVARESDDAVLRIDAPTGDRIGGPIPVGDRPIDVAVGFDSVWSADFGAASVSRIGPR